jgi:hypothetical protein
MTFADERTFHEVPMASLLVSNRYLKNASVRRRLLLDSAHQSSTFEGARGLKKTSCAQKDSRKRRAMASAKKSRKAA